MDVVTVLVDVVIGLWILAVIVGIVRAWRVWGPRLVQLQPEAQNRFTRAWGRISTKFLDAPREAAQEADVLLLSLLRERGHSLQESRLPTHIQDARRWVSLESVEGTEALRQAMRHYEVAFKRMLGPRPRAETQERRRELA